jgi:hypothetical protein
MICGTWHQHSYKMGPPLDVHDSPVGEIPGAYVQANYFEALTAGRYFGSFAEWGINVIELIAIFGAAALILRTEKWWLRAILALSPAVVMVVFSYVFLQNIGAFFECSIPVIVLLSHMLLEKILEWRRLAMTAERQGIVLND